jgi:hypothetical protein
MGFLLIDLVEVCEQQGGKWRKRKVATFVTGSAAKGLLCCASPEPELLISLVPDAARQKEAALVLIPPTRLMVLAPCLSFDFFRNPLDNRTSVMYNSTYKTGPLSIPMLKSDFNTVGRIFYPSLIQGPRDGLKNRPTLCKSVLDKDRFHHPPIRTIAH